MADLRSLTSRLASSATGFGAVIDGVLNIRSVTETANMAAYNALYLAGHRILTNCADPDCDCKLRLLAQLRPDIRIVRVAVEVSDV